MRDNHSHKEQAGENLPYAHKPQRIDMVGIEQKTRAGTRETPKRTAHQRGQNARNHLARRRIVEAVAPCTAGAAAELVSSLGHDKIGRRRHRYRSLFACTLRCALLLHSTPPKSIGNKALKL